MRDEELSPRHLLALLSPRLALDELVFGDWRLFDCYRLSDSEPVRIELRRAGEGAARLRVSVEPEPAGGFRFKPPARAPGLGLSYQAETEDGAGMAACKAIAAALREVLGPEPRRWRVSEPGLAGLAESIAAELRWAPAEFGREPDAALLRRDFEHYERLYGARPQVRQVSVLGRALPGISIHYPAAQNGTVPNSAAVYPSPLRIAHRRHMRRYFGALGCVFDEQAYARTVPTPTTLARALRGREGLARVRPRVIAGVSASLLPVHWGTFVRRDLLPVSVAPSWAVAIHEQRRKIGPLAQIPCDVGMLVHDMGLHALALHAVPAEAWDELAHVAIAQVRARPHHLLLGRFGLLARLARFFEDSVTTACWRAWAEADEPEDFAEMFAPHHAELRRELDAL